MKRCLLLLCFAAWSDVVPRVQAALDETAVSLLRLYKPIQQRVGSELELDFRRDQSIGVTHHISSVSANGIRGAANDWFILEVHSMTSLSSFKPTRRPSTGEAESKVEPPPELVEFHLYPTGDHGWMEVDVWGGSAADRQLISELLTAASKNAAAMRKFFGEASKLTTDR